MEQRYPSGRVVKNVLDASGDLSMVQSARCMDAAAGTDADCTAQAGLWNYAKNFTYNPAGAVTSMQLGNGRFTSVDPLTARASAARFPDFLLFFFCGSRPPLMVGMPPSSTVSSVARYATHVPRHALH